MSTTLVLLVRRRLQDAFKPLKDTFSGTIKLQDVRATEIDKVDLHQAVRLGDVVRSKAAAQAASRPLPAAAVHGMVPLPVEALKNATLAIIPTLAAALTVVRLLIDGRGNA